MPWDRAAANAWQREFRKTPEGKLHVRTMNLLHYRKAHV